MKRKILTAIEIISGLASLLLLVLNASFMIELVKLYTENVPDDPGAQLGNGLGKGLILVFLIIFMAIMDAVALIRWVIYTARSAKIRGGLKTILIQLPFFAVFTALFAWLYSLASENIELGGAILSSLLGGIGMTFIFADVDLYKKIFCRSSKSTEVTTDNAQQDGK